jgi:hypothetical protein
MHAPREGKIDGIRADSGQTVVNGAPTAQLPVSKQHRIAEVLFPTGVVAFGLVFTFTWIGFLVWIALRLLF